MNRHLGKGILFIKVICRSRKQQQKLHSATVCYGKARGCRMEVILPFCVSRVMCCLGWAGSCASTCRALSEPLWTLSQVKGKGLLLGKVVAGDGNFTFLLFALHL